MDSNKGADLGENTLLPGTIPTIFQVKRCLSLGRSVSVSCAAAEKTECRVKKEQIQDRGEDFIELRA